MEIKFTILFDVFFKSKKTFSRNIFETLHRTSAGSIEKTSPSRNVLGRVAPLLLLVVHRTVAAALLPRGDPVKAHVELLTVLGVGELGVVDGQASAVDPHVLGALETVGQRFTNHSAALGVIETSAYKISK